MPMYNELGNLNTRDYVEFYSLKLSKKGRYQITKRLVRLVRDENDATVTLLSPVGTSKVMIHSEGNISVVSEGYSYTRCFTQKQFEYMAFYGTVRHSKNGVKRYYFIGSDIFEKEFPDCPDNIRSGFELIRNIRVKPFVVSSQEESE